VKKPNGERIVVWANTVVEARYSLSVPEQRLILWLASQIERDDNNLKEHTVGVLEMQELAGTNNGRIYEQFEEMCTRLQGRVLEIQLDEAKRRKINWLDHSDYNDGEGTVTLRFDDRLRPALLELRERFAAIPLKTVFKLRGGYAIRWYEMLVSKKYLGSFSMSVSELRDWLHIEEDELSAVKDLRKRAIDVSKAELDAKADLTFRYEPIKSGRRVTGWKFKIKTNQPAPIQRQLPLRPEPELTPEEAAEAKAARRAAIEELRRRIRG
jgi:plasmid replication initiation protein